MRTGLANSTRRSIGERDLVTTGRSPPSLCRWNSVMTPANGKCRSSASHRGANAGQLVAWLSQSWCSLAIGLAFSSAGWNRFLRAPAKSVRPAARSPARQALGATGLPDARFHSEEGLPRQRGNALPGRRWRPSARTGIVAARPVECAPPRRTGFGGEQHSLSSDTSRLCRPG